jgi:hypothetical protein
MVEQITPAVAGLQLSLAFKEAGMPETPCESQSCRYRQNTGFHVIGEASVLLRGRHYPV